MNHTDPFFILANPRSGSSLLRIICDCNEFLSVPPESGFLLWWKSKYSSATTDTWKDREFLLRFVEDVISSKKFETWNIHKEELFEFIIENLPRNYSEAGSLVYHFQAIKRGKTPLFWGDKNNYYINHLEDIITLYPNANFIHLVRDGRDVACSYLNLKEISSDSIYFPILPDKIDEIANEWVNNNIQINKFLEGTSKKNHLVIKYEDVILSLKDSCMRICEFLEVSFDSNMLEYDQLNRKNLLEPIDTLDWKRRTLKRPDKSRIKQYASQLKKNDLKIFYERGKEVLNKYGYV